MSINQDYKDPKDMTGKDIAEEMKFCVDVGQLLFNTLIKETGGYGPRVILSASVLLVALCEGKEGILDTILEGVAVLDEQIDQAKTKIMAEARAASIN